MELAMKIRDFIQRGRELYACCPGPHDDSGLPSPRRVPLDLSKFDPDLDSINHERMPVLLSEEADFETWLSGSPAEAFALARSFDPGAMRIVQ
jgi:hypothetical protein